MLQISRVQFDALEGHARDHFFAGLDSYLQQSFPEYGSLQREELISQCRQACEALRIRHEDGIYAFHVVSFMFGSPLNEQSDYRAAHRRYVLLGYPADQLPIDLQAAFSEWAHY